MWRRVPTHQLRARTCLFSTLSAVHTLLSQNISILSVLLARQRSRARRISFDTSLYETTWSVGSEKRVHNADKDGDLYYCCPTQATVAGKMTATECGLILSRCQTRATAGPPPPSPKSGGGNGGGVSIWAVVRILACVFLKAIMFVCLLVCSCPYLCKCVCECVRLPLCM